MRTILIFVFVVLVAAAPVQETDQKIEKFHSIAYDRFWTYDEIVDWMNHLNEEYPEITEVFPFGRTHEGREIMGIRVTNEANLAAAELPIIFITAATSGRDWITAMTAVNLIHMLAEYREQYGELIDYIDWYILPVANPDGYIFSMTEGNRDWVKNRKVNPGSDCIGVNIERNFDWEWETDVNSSNDPCSENYRGESAASEEETISIQFAVDIFSRIQPAYVTLKAGAPDTFNGKITYPFAFSSEALPPFYGDARYVGEIMSNNARQRTGARYRLGGYANLNQATAGTSMDYAVAIDNVPLSFTIFTPPANSRFGWDVGVSSINPIADQVFFTMESLGRYVLEMPVEDWKKQ